MGKTKRNICILILMLCSTLCFAGQISIQIVQHDDSTVDITEQSLIIEDNLLNGFFSAGYIVTNSPAVVSNSADEDAVLLKKGIGEAFEGYSDYFVQIKLYYRNDRPAETKKSDLIQIDWSIVKASTGVVVTSNTIDNGDKSESLYNMADDLLIQIKKSIKA